MNEAGVSAGRSLTLKDESKRQAEVMHFLGSTAEISDNTKQCSQRGNTNTKCNRNNRGIPQPAGWNSGKDLSADKSHEYIRVEK
jgi:hypothetical protein